MSTSFKRRLLLTSVAAGVLGLGLSQSAFSQVDMDISVSVRNTLEATVVNSLSFGELFVTEALAAASSSGLRAAGTAGATALTELRVGAGMTFISLGGAERGEVAVTVPSNTTTAYTVTLDGLTDDVTGWNGTADCQSDALDNVVSLQSPVAGAPLFHVYNWRIAAGPGSSAVSSTVMVPGTGEATATVTPLLAGDQSTFYIGARIATECVDAPYSDQAPYTGLVTINVNY